MRGRQRGREGGRGRESAEAPDSRLTAGETTLRERLLGVEEKGREE